VSGSSLDRLLNAVQRTSAAIRTSGWVIGSATVVAVRQQAVSGERLWWQVVGVGVAGFMLTAVALRWAHRLGALCRSARQEVGLRA
jgi:hypothetical protein